MKLFSAPLTVFSAAFGAWHWSACWCTRREALHTVDGHPEELPVGQITSLQETGHHYSIGGGADYGLGVADVEAEGALGQLNITGNPVDARSLSPSSDMFKDAWDVSWRVAKLFQDVLSFVFESVVAHVWQWPADSSAAFHRFDATVAFTWWAGLGFDGFDVELLPDLREWLLFVRSTVSDVAEGVGKHGVATLGSAVDHLDFWVPPDVSVQLQKLCEVAASYGRHAVMMFQRASAEAFTAIAGLQCMARNSVEAFLERHPEHRASLDNRDPLLILVWLLLLPCFVTWRVCACVKIVKTLMCWLSCIVRGTLRLRRVASCCCCHMCRSRLRPAGASCPKGTEQPCNAPTVVKGQCNLHPRATVKLARRGGA
mmetsp:Transcript_83127/g.193101  ORF Transcript_83127/g.193101 Transcript_83127/m.193101 type:complete len:371 (-) Transcript_83127:104-1216(-)